MKFHPQGKLRKSLVHFSKMGMINIGRHLSVIALSRSVENFPTALLDLSFIVQSVRLALK